MKSFNGARWCVAFAAAVALAGCGSRVDGNIPSTNPSALSADQRAFEQFLLAPNASSSLGWELPVTGTPVSGTHFFIESHASIAASPLTAGPQKLTTTAWVSLARTLGLPAVIVPSRVVMNGQIIVASGQSNVSYQGTGVRFDALAADGATVIDSVLRSNYSVVPLSGAVTAAPTDFAQFFNSLYFNPTLLNAAATWSAGAAYEKFTGTQIGDVYTVGDFTSATTGNLPAPVAINTTIAALITAGGIAADGTTYTLANGSESVINGVTTYVATNPVPNETTTGFRTFYELNGNVYVGALIRSGTMEGGNPFPVATPGAPGGFTNMFTQQFQIRLNAAAVASLKAALTF